jgi:tripartite-type tricarboxylate transporter receptor subunit TctC
MNSWNRRDFVGLAAPLALAALGRQAWAADAFPSKQVRIIAPVPAGNGSDVAMRLIAKELTEMTGQPFIVENRPGGNTVIGAQVVITGPADGYLLYAGSNASMAANAVAFKELGYDPVRDFAPVAMVIRAPWVLVTSATSPYKTIEDLVAAGKRDPKLLSSADGSAGFQLATALFANMTGLTINQALYKGAAPAVQDLAGDQVSLAIVDLSTALPLIRGGKLRPLLMMSKERSARLPDVPTVHEKGYGDMPLQSWAALYAKAGTPPAVVDQLASLVERATRSPNYLKYVADVNSEVGYLGPDALRSFNAKQIQDYRKAMQLAGIQPQ